jgi:hypothetical protein
MTRRITVDGVEYRYVVGATFVKITGPALSRAVMLIDIKGLDWDAIERGRRKRTSDGMVRPSEVTAYIRAALDSQGGQR